MFSRSNFGVKVSGCLGNPASQFDIEEGSCKKGVDASCDPYTNTDSTVSFPPCCIANAKDPRCYASGTSSGGQLCYPEGHGQLYQGGKPVSGMGKSGEAVQCGTCGKYQFKDGDDNQCYNLSDDSQNPTMCKYSDSVSSGCGSKVVSKTPKSSPPDTTGSTKVVGSKTSQNNVGSKTPKSTPSDSSGNMSYGEGVNPTPNNLDPLMILLIAAIILGGLYFFVVKKKGKSFFGKRK